jgi:hypothetical protein
VLNSEKDGLQKVMNMPDLYGGFIWWIYMVDLYGRFRWWIYMVDLDGGFRWWI